ncbi:hypothetical protein GETHPA_09100 [Geothrix rubra]|uniref:Sel1 repeat family protein n=1 Tax=Geothrix rubra TaxID=2927977 RepID=A0ABQ5Q447_9BACT|nr:hypothetical protein [Geothrix rubra]GLH69377.1 hypothetical protein GETHPA_09100 [Geothrix rubra]
MPAPQFQAEAPATRIQLGEIPPPRTPSTRMQDPLPTAPPADLPLDEGAGGPRRPSRLAPIKAMVKEAYFDPARAFQDSVDWPRFRKAQVALFLVSLVMPFFALLALGFVLGVIYLTGASLYSATSPSPIYQLMLYPLVFVLARGYWIAYLALPLGLFLVGWLWSVPTAWLLSRIAGGSHIDFRKALSILAMLGAMLAPFTMFPFLRLLALGVILWHISRRMEDTFDIGFWRLVGRGGPLLLCAAFLYGAFERSVESYFPGGEDLKANLYAFVNQKKMLEWPTFQAKVYVSPNERLFDDLSDFNTRLREQAVVKAMAILKNGSETPDFRFRIANRMAENGQAEAYPYLSRYYAEGQGTPADPAAALNWMQRFTDANPGNLDAGLERAHLLLRNGRRLDGKRYLVGMAKGQITQVPRIAEFIQKEGLGRSDRTFNFEVLNLYQQGNTSSTVGMYPGGPGQPRYVYETQTKQESLRKTLYQNDRDQSLWFYRALVAEYASGTAGAEVYGESTSELAQAELDRKAKEGDPVAMDILADRYARDGDILAARRLWVSATQALDTDNRFANVAYYMKLAGSYDPAESTQAPDVQQATKYYLAALLVSTWHGRSRPVGRGSLERLHPGKVPDPLGQPFLDLCLKHDIPEAWFMMGDRCLNGDFPGVPKNAVKAQDCFRKARALGYQSPQLSRQLAATSGPGASPRGASAG